MPIPFFGLRKHDHLQLVHDIRNFTSFHRSRFARAAASWQASQWKKSRRVITVSEFSKKQLVSYCGVDQGTILVAYNGVGSEYFKRRVSRARSIDFIFVGIFEKRKNHLKLLEALSIISSEGISFNCELIGAVGDSLDECIDFISKADLEGSVRITEQVSDESELINKYCNSKIFVSPSCYEGFGMPLVESMALGCQVVCSELEVFEEICGSKATYFDPRSSLDIAHALKSALSKAEEVDRNALAEYAEQNFSWTKTVDGLVAQL